MNCQLKYVTSSTGSENFIHITDHRDIDRRLHDDRYRRSGSREKRIDHINNKERSSSVDDRNHTNRDTSHRPIKDKPVQKPNTKQTSIKSQSGRDHRVEVN